MPSVKTFPAGEYPRSRGDLHVWIREHLKLSTKLESDLFAAVDAVFTDFERLVADLTDKSHRDPKTKLINFETFTERLQSFLKLEQRGRWCAVGFADVAGFKWYNDTLGHAVGDRIIERVAQLLREQARADDLIANERPGSRSRELHARFGGDEFCFLIPGLQEPSQAYAIGERFRTAVAQYGWTVEDDRLAAHPVLVDVGLVCLSLGPDAERRFIARRLAADLIQRADRLMYEAKGERARRIRFERLEIDNGELIALIDRNEPAAADLQQSVSAGSCRSRS
jgi:diguanylate cyclase (GGDEF)-like protein